MMPINKLVLCVAAAVALAGPALPLAAQGTPSPITLSGDVKAVKIVTDKDGKQKTELVEPDTIVPGDRLVFGTDYANKGAEPVTNFVVTNPVPAAVQLAPDADTALELSVDGGKTWGVLAKLTLANPDGTTRPATHSDVTHVRWVLPSIAPGASGRLTYPAIIR
jgi:uncharacterized repeat protein (TIGR01451 family)